MNMVINLIVSSILQVLVAWGQQTHPPVIPTFPPPPTMSTGIVK